MGNAISLVGSDRLDTDQSASWDLWLRPALAAAAAAVSFYSVVMQNQKSAVDTSDLHFRWNRSEWSTRAYRENVYVDDALERLNALVDRSAELSKAGNSFPNRTSALRRWQQYVQEQHGVHA